MERTFFFLVFCPQGLGQYGGAKCNSDEAKQNYFCGRKRICFALALFCGDLVSAAQEGAEGMRGGYLIGISDFTLYFPCQKLSDTI
ncbi:MAG TPA: hypothetical protein VG941_02815 [Candidatus Paceibacterota bacterium]|nr:hypothetical protein [Candidatus Paceibacterota bacterium]